jgi:hypothetical protein
MDLNTWWTQEELEDRLLKFKTLLSGTSGYNNEPVELCRFNSSSPIVSLTIGAVTEELDVSDNAALNRLKYLLLLHGLSTSICDTLKEEYDCKR